MDRSASRRRGPRMVPAKGLEFREESVVLMHRLYGRMIATIRTSLDASQQQLAEATHMPPSTISKLENGSIIVGIYHLDALAGAFNQLGTEVLGADPVWRGWELHELADEISLSMEKEGYVTMWSSPDDAGKEMVPDRKLGALVRAHWPEGARKRIGW
jgi:transcriptional regulator with XRE-family HTH domain